MSFNLAAFVADDADLDHFTPVLHKFVERHPQARVSVVVYHDRRHFSDDYRVRHLTSLGIDVQHAIASAGTTRAPQPAYFALAGSRRRAFRAAARLWRDVMWRGPRFGSREYAERFFTTEPGRSVAAIVHNHHNPRLAPLVERARRFGVTSVALPHAADNFDNRLTLATRLNYPVRAHLLPVHGDRIVTSSHIAREVLVAEGRAAPDRVTVLGSARFCGEWQQVLARIAPTAASVGPDGHFRILLLLPKPESNVFEAELLRIVETICRLPCVFVAVKMHPRSELAGHVRAPNVRFFGDDLSSRALIQWADLTLFSATSTVVDCIVLDRPAVFLRRTMHNKLTVERYVDSWAVDCRDDLCETILRLQSGTQSRTYSREERAALLREMVEPAGADVLKLYVDELEAAVERAPSGSMMAAPVG